MKVAPLLEAKISIQPGTGVHGIAYQDEIQVLQFQAGESKKDLHLPTLYFAGDKTLDFYLNLTVDGQLVDQLQVQVSYLTKLKWLWFCLVWISSHLSSLAR